MQVKLKVAVDVDGGLVWLDQTVSWRNFGWESGKAEIKSRHARGQITNGCCRCGVDAENVKTSAISVNVMVGLGGDNAEGISHAAGQILPRLAPRRSGCDGNPPPAALKDSVTSATTTCLKLPHQIADIIMKTGQS